MSYKYVLFEDRRIVHRIVEGGITAPYGYMPTRALYEMGGDVFEMYPFGIHWIVKLYYFFLRKEGRVARSMVVAYRKGYDHAMATKAFDELKK